MAIKNFTTEIKVEKTVMEIESILAKHGVRGIMKSYDDSGRICAVTFQADLGERGFMTFKLPMKINAVLNITNKLVDKKKLPAKYRNNTDKAMKIGWRIIKDWIDSQMALIEIEMCDVAEVFLPYAYDGKQTLYEHFEEKGFDMFLLGDGNQ